MLQAVYSDADRLGLRQYYGAIWDIPRFYFSELPYAYSVLASPNMELMMGVGSDLSGSMLVVSE